MTYRNVNVNFNENPRKPHKSCIRKTFEKLYHENVFFFLSDNAAKYAVQHFIACRKTRFLIKNKQIV